MATTRRIDKYLYRHTCLLHGTSETQPHYELWQQVGTELQTIGYILFYRHESLTEIPESFVFGDGRVRLHLPISELPAIQHLFTHEAPIYLRSSATPVPGHHTPSNVFLATGLEEPGDMDE